MFTELIHELALIYYDIDTKLHTVYLYSRDWGYLPELTESFANIDEAKTYIKSYC